MVSALLFLRQEPRKSNCKKPSKSALNYNIYHNIILDIDKSLCSPYTGFTNYERRQNHESKF